MSDAAAEKPTENELFEQGQALHKAGRYDETEELCQQWLKVLPRSVPLWNLRGVNFRMMKRQPDAIGCFRMALAASPRNAAVWSNLGNALKDSKRCEAAVVCHRRAVALEPKSLVSLHNLGIALTAAGRDGEAIAAYDRALQLDPSNAKVLWDRAQSRLRLGQYGEGWPDYRARTRTGSLPDRALPGEWWTGQRYDGKRLLVVSEQGLGDTIWVARYLRRVKNLGGELVVESRPQTAALIAAMGVADRIVPKQDPLPDADFHILQCSVPGIFTKDEASVPSAPYIQPPREHLDRLGAVMAEAGNRLRVGIVWGGSASYEARADRDASLGHFLQHFAYPWVRFYSLQKGPQADDLKAFPPDGPVFDLSPHTADFNETAAAIAHLDLVVMTDTAVAHLTGAMGKPVWVLLCRAPHWLWQLNRADSSWYPSMRLFRQRVWGDWNGVFDEAAAALLTVARRPRGTAAP